MPETRGRTDAKTIDLHVVVVPSRSREPARSAFTVLAGGPGQAATEVGAMLLPAFSSILDTHDILLVDQRGTGRSAPLECTAPPIDTLAELTRTDVDVDALQRCLAGYDADVPAYTTPHAMDDLDVVREQLGYDQLDLWGASYGTRAALVYMRRFPQRVRTAVLDGVAPPDMAMPRSFADDMQRAFDLVLEACTHDSACAQAFPRLHDDTHDLFERLRAAPISTTLAHPRTGRTETVEVTMTTLSAAVRLMLYQSENAVLLPWTLTRAHAGDFGPLFAQADAATAFADSMSHGMHYAVICSEDAPRTLPSDLAPLAGNDDSPRLDGTFMVEAFRQACAHWPARPLPPAYYEPVRSDTPTLFLSGERDPVTPARWADRSARHFTNAKTITVPGVGHNTIAATCVRELVATLVRTGNLNEIDDRCVDAHVAPPFLLDAAAAKVATTTADNAEPAP